MVTIKRKLYKRGSSFETTIPKPLLFALDPEHKKYHVLFHYDQHEHRWWIDFEEIKEDASSTNQEDAHQGKKTPGEKAGDR